MIWARRMTLTRKKMRFEVVYLYTRNMGFLPDSAKSLMSKCDPVLTGVEDRRSSSCLRHRQRIWQTVIFSSNHLHQHPIRPKKHITTPHQPLQTLSPTHLTSRNRFLSRHNQYGASRPKSTRKRPPPPVLRPPRPQPKRHTRHPRLTTPPRQKQLPRSRSPLFPRRRQRRQRIQRLRPRQSSKPLSLSQSLLLQWQQQQHTPTFSPTRTTRRTQHPRSQTSES